MKRSEITEKTVIDAYCRAEIVLIGSVEKSMEARRSIFESKIWPEKNLKGVLESPVYALSETSGACGYPFREGGRYLIFASRREDTNYISASICGWTQLIAVDSFFVGVIDDLNSEENDPCSKEAVAERRHQYYLDEEIRLRELRERLLDESEKE